MPSLWRDVQVEQEEYDEIVAIKALYRSPHANAMVERIDTSVAKKVPGIEAIFTWEDVDQNGTA